EKFCPSSVNPLRALPTSARRPTFWKPWRMHDPNDQELRAELANCYQAVGDLQGHSGLQNLGDPDAALASYRKGLAIYQSQVASNQNVKDARRGLAVLQMRIGDLQMSHGDAKDAISQYRTALGMLEELAASDPTNAEAR